jgi:hypothetical protein
VWSRVFIRVYASLACDQPRKEQAMVAKVANDDVAEYLAEIRDQVCSRCVERPPGGPPCAPLGKDCGIELHLPQLIDSIHAVNSRWIPPYLDHNRHEICEKCALLHSSVCPCPMDYLASLVVEAVETVDQRHENREQERPFVADPTNEFPDEIEQIRAAFAEGRGTWTRCDWPTHFGHTGLDLNGMTWIEAEAMAEKTRGTVEAADWRAAATWLTTIQKRAAQAEVEASAAVDAASAGEWSGAKRHAEHAWLLEFTTGRPLRRMAPPAWLRLRQAIVNACNALRLEALDVQGQD